MFSRYTLALVSFILFSYLLSAAHSTASVTTALDTYLNEYSEKDSIVLPIFKAKCNICHLKKKQVIFKFDNLSDYRQLINEQVLIKKRMPKGRAFILTKAEREMIRFWVQNP